MAEPTPYPGADLLLNFADGEYRFELTVLQIAELQEKCGAGVGEIFARLYRGRLVDGNDVLFVATEAQFRSEDIFETIRLGLIGGGKGWVNEAEVKVDAFRARVLLERYVHPRPLIDSWQLATAILAARVVGYDDGRPKGVGDKPAQKKSEQPAEDGSASPTA
jgi:hypothetical protein